MTDPHSPVSAPRPRPPLRPSGGRSFAGAGCLIALSITLGAGLLLSLFFNLILLAVSVGEPVPGRKLREEHLFGKGGEKVVVVPIEGILLRRTSPGLFGVSFDMVEHTKKQLRQASDDEDVKAIVVEIDSPGGSVTASDILHKEVKRAREEGKKVVVLMGDLCASGGYYVAVGADKIYAHPTSLTGSIGAIMGGLEFSGLMEEFGVKENVVKSGPVKDILSPTRPMTDAERKILQGVVDGAYGRFVDLVAEGRSMTREELGDSTDGRIFLAPQAKERGLLDEIGYLEDAVDGAKALAGVTEARVVRYRKEPTLAEVLFGVEAAGPAGRPAGGLPIPLPDTSPRLLYLYRPGM